MFNSIKSLDNDTIRSFQEIDTGVDFGNGSSVTGIVTFAYHQLDIILKNKLLKKRLLKRASKIKSRKKRKEAYQRIKKRFELGPKGKYYKKMFELGLSEGVHHDG